MKRCPFCAEEIQDEAIVCKHCGREIAEVPAPPAVGVRDQQGRERKSDRERLAIVAIFVGTFIALAGPFLPWISQDGTIVLVSNLPYTTERSFIDYGRSGFDFTFAWAILGIVVVLFLLGLLAALIKRSARSWIAVAVLIASLACVLASVAVFAQARHEFSVIQDDIAEATRTAGSVSELFEFRMNNADVSVVPFGIAATALGGAIAAVGGFTVWQVTRREIDHSPGIYSMR